MPLHSVHQEIISDITEEIYGIRYDNGEFSDLTFDEYKNLLKHLEEVRDLQREFKDMFNKKYKSLGGV